MVEDTLNIRKELEKALKEGNLRFGQNQTVRALKQGLLTRIYYATNIPTKLKNDLEYYAKLAEIQLIPFPGDAKELGVTLKRAHSVLVAGIAKA